MYNGIGLQTARGSGTNGHVQRNWALVRNTKDKVKYRTEEEIVALDAAANKQPNQEILDHERKRKVELKCIEFQEILEDQGYPVETITAKVENYRTMLMGHDAKADAPKDQWGRVSVTETHQVAEAQQEKNAKLREAFGISEYFVEGTSLDPTRQAKEELARSAAIGATVGASPSATPAKKYDLVRTPSPEKERERKKKKTRDSSSEEEPPPKKKSKKSKKHKKDRSGKKKKSKRSKRKPSTDSSDSDRSDSSDSEDDSSSSSGEETKKKKRKNKKHEKKSSSKKKRRASVSSTEKTPVKKSKSEKKSVEEKPKNGNNDKQSKRRRSSERENTRKSRSPARHNRYYEGRRYDRDRSYDRSSSRRNRSPEYRRRDRKKSPEKPKTRKSRSPQRKRSLPPPPPVKVVKEVKIDEKELTPEIRRKQRSNSRKQRYLPSRSRSPKTKKLAEATPPRSDTPTTKRSESPLKSSPKEQLKKVSSSESGDNEPSKKPKKKRTPIQTPVVRLALSSDENDSDTNGAPDFKIDEDEIRTLKLLKNDLAAKAKESIEKKIPRQSSLVPDFVKEKVISEPRIDDSPPPLPTGPAPKKNSEEILKTLTKIEMELSKRAAAAKKESPIKITLDKIAIPLKKLRKSVDKVVSPKKSRSSSRSSSRRRRNYSSSSSRSRSRSRSHSRSASRSRSRSASSSSDSGSSRSNSSGARSRSSRSRSPSIPRRYGSPSFLDRRRITSARKRPIPYHRPTPSSPSSVSSYSSRGSSPWFSRRSRSASPVAHASSRSPTGTPDYSR